MGPEDQIGYALRSWARFEGELTDDLTRAITSAFVLIVCADGDVATEEVAEFERTLTRLEPHLQRLDFAQVRRLFADVSGAFLTDPANGSARALAAIRGVKDNREHAELVIGAAEMAVTADSLTRPRETTALEKVYSALDVVREN